jgi:hypothetical protein
MQFLKNVSAKEAIITIALLIVFGVAYTFVLRYYKQEGERRTAAISEEGERDPNHIEVFVKVVSVDPIKGDMNARLEFLPHGNLTADEGLTISKDLKLFTNSATGKQEHEFSKGKRMNPIEVVVSFHEGQSTDYPFDEHKGELAFYFAIAPPKPGGGAGDKKEGAPPTPTPSPTPTTPPAEGEQPKSETASKTDGAAKEDDDEEVEIPIAVDFIASIQGLQIEATKSKESTKDYVAIDMVITRASTVVFFSVFIMVVMWALTIAVVFLTLSIILADRKIEMGQFSFLAALLFSFLALRGSQPAAPPIGSLSDFLAFFWAEVIIASCLVSIITTWLLRPAAK